MTITQRRIICGYKKRQPKKDEDCAFVVVWGWIIWLSLIFAFAKLYS